MSLQGNVLDVLGRTLVTNWTLLSFQPIIGAEAAAYARGVTGDDGRSGVVQLSSRTLSAMTVQPTRLGTTRWARTVTDGCSVVTTSVLLAATCKALPSISMLTPMTSQYNVSAGSFRPLVITASVSGSSATDSLSMRWIYARVRDCAWSLSLI